MTVGTERERPSAPDVGLGEDDVHVWRVGTSLPAEQVARLERSLSPDERRRAERYRTTADRRRFIVARGVLRSLLGRYVRCAPHALVFSYGHAGKPELPAPSSGVTFNVAHSGEMALVAVARRRVGVDLEAVRELAELDRIAQRFFSPREQAELRALPPRARLPAFFRGWTQKEALVKAIGAGLTHPLDQVEVPLARSERPTDVAVAAAGNGSPTAFTLQTLHAGAGFAAALAVEDRVRPVRISLRRCPIDRWGGPH